VVNTAAKIAVSQFEWLASLDRIFRGFGQRTIESNLKAVSGAAINHVGAPDNRIPMVDNQCPNAPGQRHGPGIWTREVGHRSPIKILAYHVDFVLVFK
jgi:hypothetical protein